MAPPKVRPASPPAAPAALCTPHRRRFVASRFCSPLEPLLNQVEDLHEEDLRPAGEGPEPLDPS